MTTTTSRVLHPMLELERSDGKLMVGRLEHFPEAKGLILFDDEELSPIPLTVPAGEAPDAHAALGDGQVLLRNWTEHRGVPDQLASHGLVGLTDEQVQVGMFRLHAVIANVL